MRNVHQVKDFVEANKKRLIDLSDEIWEAPELAYQEERSARAHARELQRHGFAVQSGIAGIPTALMGEAGSGGPVIAFIGEFDALPNLSQEANIVEQRVLIPGGNGHGCGHNLLGAGALLAAIGLSQWLAANGIPGRVRYYGCPAEEGGAGKAFMVREGCFDGCDVAISWHPGSLWEVRAPFSLANIRADFSFTGRSSHAAASPHLGRSALDAVELMNVGVNYLREHIPSRARVHYAIIDAGGVAPNVVQARATVRYSIRAAELIQLQELIDRVRKVADGAALMTETSVEMRILAGVANLLANQPLETALQAALEELGPPDFDEEDMRFARQIQQTFAADDIAAAFRAIGLEPTATPLADFVVPGNAVRSPMVGSTDLGDVSWLIPTVQATSPCFALGTQLHSWQVVAQGKSPAAHKAMVHVAKAMAMAGAAVATNPALREEARAELARRRAGHAYRSPIPPGTAPPLAMSGV